MLSFKNIVDIREPHEHNQVSFSTVFSSYKEEKKKIKHGMERMEIITKGEKFLFNEASFLARHSWANQTQIQS